MKTSPKFITCFCLSAALSIALSSNHAVTANELSTKLNTSPPNPHPTCPKTNQHWGNLEHHRRQKPWRRGIHRHSRNQSHRHRRQPIQRHLENLRRHLQRTRLIRKWPVIRRLGAGWRNLRPNFVSHQQRRNIARRMDLQRRQRQSLGRNRHPRQQRRPWGRIPNHRQRQRRRIQWKSNHK